MILDSIKIKNFRKLKDCEIKFKETTFLIGQNNSGKSSVFKALDFLHKNINVSPDDYAKHYDEEKNDFIRASEIEMIAEYSNIPEEANDWIGFRGRLLPDEGSTKGTTTYKIKYKKIWKIESTKPEIYIYEKEKSKKERYISAQTPRDLISDELPIDFLSEYFGESNLDTQLTSKQNKDKLNDLPQIWSVADESLGQWVKNPGGIPGNILSKLPNIVIIPAESCISELTSQNGALLGLLSELFQEVRDSSENYSQAQIYLSRLAKEMDPQDSETNFGVLMNELNELTHSLFPDASVHVSANLDDANKVIKPMFNVEMESNVRTSVSYQGHGMIRSTAFQLLKFIQDFINKKMTHPRSTILCFEEPEIYLHPAAANQMRDALYDFAGNNHQIVATTHSPYMINLGSEKSISLTKFSIKDGFSSTNSFNLDDAFIKLQSDEKQNLKMLLKIDDYIARIFFTQKCIFVEGDTEEVVFRETIKRLSHDDKALVIGNCEILRARGKAVLISLAKYLNALNIDYIFMHDADSTTPKAAAMNPLILAQTGESKRIMVNECIEDLLGYPAPSKDKPYKAYSYISDNWGDAFHEIPSQWRNVFIKLCSPYIDHLHVE